MPIFSHSLLLSLLLFLHSSSILAFEGLLQAAGEVRKDLPSVPERFALPDWSIYHRTDHLYQTLASFLDKCPSAKLLTVNPPPLQHPTQDPPNSEPPAEALRYITISPRLSAKSFANRLMHKPVRAMFVFGETGRDLLTSEIALRVVKHFCAQNVSLSFPDMQLILVPLANPTGRRIAEMGRRCERTNANDVDLDRNWPTFWNYPTSIREDDAAQKRTVRDAGRVLGVRLGRAAGAHAMYPHVQPGSPGTQPLSEPESRALKEIVELVKPVSYVNLRTGAVAMTIPWDCRVDVVPEKDRGRLLRVAEGVAASHCQRCSMGNLWNVTGRTKCGTAADYLFEEVKVPFVHTWHVYNVPEAPRGDCFRRHNPTTREGYERVVNNWAHAVLNFTTAVHNWMTLERSVGIDMAEQNASLSAAEAVARREDDMARGMPDPESMEDEQTGGMRRTGSASLNGAEARDANKSVTQGNEGKIRLIGWMFNNDRQSSGKARVPNPLDLRIGPHMQKESSKHDEEDRFGPLTGWLGVSTAMFMLAAGMFIVRRFVFKRSLKKSGLLRRRPVKNA